MAAIREGLPVSVVDEVLAEGRLAATELDRLALPRKTLAHRRTLGRLTAEQSDRLVRILRWRSWKCDCTSTCRWNCCRKTMS
jgi:uncharacterized protein (DUF2384 family)